MVQLIAIAALGGVAMVAYSSFRKHWDEIQKAEAEERRAKDVKTIGELEQDPETGRYRVKKHD